MVVGVVRHIPAGAFELNSRGGDQLLNGLFSTFRAGLQGWIGELHNALKAIGTGSAFVLV